MKNFFRKTKFIFATLVVAVFCVGAYATTDIQPNGNLSGGNMAANCTQPVLGTYSGSTNFEAKWRANEVPLRWYNEGTLLDVQDAADTCTYDGLLNIPTTAPSRTGYTFAGWKLRMPGTYTELEYIESTGTQWIETPYSMNAQTVQDNGVYDFDLDIQFTNTNQRVVFGYGVNSATYWDITAGRTKYDVIEGSYSVFDRHILSAHTVVDVNADKKIFNTSKVIINGQVVGTGTGYRSTLASGGHFRTAQNSTSEMYPTFAKIYGLIQYQFGTKVFNGIPARRNSDNVVGMWDSVTQTFFTNAGTGSFVAGPVVQ